MTTIQKTDIASTNEQSELIANGFYRLPLENGKLHMTMNLLQEHCSLSDQELVLSKELKVKYYSYEQGIVTIMVKMPDRSMYRVQFEVSLDNLKVGCRCGETYYRLCVHAYAVLYRTVWLHGHLDLGMYYWPQIDEDKKLQAKFLELTTRNDRIFVEPKLRFGNLYRPGLGFKGAEKLMLTEPLDSNARIYMDGETVIGYCLAYTYRGFSTSHHPVLIPFVGTLDQKGAEVIRFDRFIRTEGDIRGLGLSDAQQTLCRMAREQNTLIDTLRKLNTEKQKATLPEIRKELFALWKQTMPLLIREQFTYSYNTHQNDHLGHRPRKTGMKRCEFSPITPSLSFMLKTYTDFYVLTPRVSVNGRTLNLQHNPDFFIYDADKNQYHILASLQDDDVLAWLSLTENKITVPTAYFDDFKMSFLHALCQSYQLF